MLPMKRVIISTLGLNRCCSHYLGINQISSFQCKSRFLLDQSKYNLAHSLNLFCTIASDNKDARVKRSQMELSESQLIPDVIPSVSRGVEVMEISYGNNKVSDGTELTPAQSHEKPKVSWPHKETTFYTLFMTDPDAPSRAEPSFREFMHWVVTDIPGDDVSKGVVLLDYLGPAPPHGSGLHRYCFFVYEQKEKGIVRVKEAKKMYESRGGKKLMQLVTDAELGDPVFGCLMVSQWGEEVDAYRKAMDWMPTEKYRSLAQQKASAAAVAPLSG